MWELWQKTGRRCSKVPGLRYIGAGEHENETDRQPGGRQYPECQQSGKWKYSRRWNFWQRRKHWKRRF